MLEAMAACKAVFEMVPDHTATQLFLAQLYAQRPKRRVVEIIGESTPISVESDVITLESRDAVAEIEESEGDFVLLDNPAESLEDFLRTQEIDVISDEDVVGSEPALSTSAEGRALQRAAAAASSGPSPGLFRTAPGTRRTAVCTATRSPRGRSDPSAEPRPSLPG